MGKNLVLVGMPACGKSTIGVLAAKALGYRFIDADLVIQEETGKLLQEIIDEQGLDAFCIAEERAICSINAQENAVIATGGSAVYSRTAMLHLKEHGIVYYLSLPTEEVKKRLYNIKSRGIAMRRGDTIEDVFARRRALYEEYADITIDCLGKDIEQLVEEITDYHRTVNMV